eukprot:3483485-Rhodomonas_salina.2
MAEVRGLLSRALDDETTMLTEVIHAPYVDYGHSIVPVSDQRNGTMWSASKAFFNRQAAPIATSPRQRLRLMLAENPSAPILNDITWAGVFLNDPWDGSPFITECEQAQYSGRRIAMAKKAFFDPEAHTTRESENFYCTVLDPPADKMALVWAPHATCESPWAA